MTEAPQTAAPESQPTPEGDAPFFVAQTQDDLNKKVGDVRGEGRDAGKAERDAELLEELGVESLDDLKSSLEAYNTAITELEGEEIADLKKQHKEALKTVQTDLDSHKEALAGYLEKEREGLPEHVTELLDTMSAPDQLAYITKHGDALRAESKPATVGRGSSPGGSSAIRADVAPGMDRIRVAYSKR